MSRSGKKNAPEYTKHQVSVVSNQLSETKLSVHGWEVEGEGEVKMGEEGGLKLRLFRFDWGLSIYHTPALSNARGGERVAPFLISLTSSYK